MSGRDLIKRGQALFAREGASADARRVEVAEQPHLDNVAGTEFEARREDVQVDEYLPGEKQVPDDE